MKEMPLALVTNLATRWLLTLVTNSTISGNVTVAMQVAPPGGQTCNKTNNKRQLLAKIRTNANVAIWYYRVATLALVSI